MLLYTFLCCCARCWAAATEISCLDTCEVHCYHQTVLQIRKSAPNVALTCELFNLNFQPLEIVFLLNAIQNFKSLKMYVICEI